MDRETIDRCKTKREIDQGEDLDGGFKSNSPYESRPSPVSSMYVLSELVQVSIQPHQSVALDFCRKSLPIPSHLISDDPEHVVVDMMI